MFLPPTVREILVGSQNYKIGSRDPHLTPFYPILHYFSLELTAVRLRANLKFQALTVREILGRSRNSKSGSRDPHMTPFDLILRFLLEFSAVRLRAKFEVSSSNRLRAKFEVSSFNGS